MDGRLRVGEVGVRKASGPTGRAVHSDTDISKVGYTIEETVELGISRLVRDVANEQGRRRVVDLLGPSLSFPSPRRALQAPALPERAIHVGGRIVHVLCVVEVDKAESSDGR